MSFPQSISFTLTNACNLRCWMCGQWSEEGYIKNNRQALQGCMTLEDWISVVDELAEHGISSVLLRGGEPFLFPGIVQLLEYLVSRNIFVAMDTNGTLLEAFAEDIVRIGRIHLTISMDGPEALHDRVRGAPGAYQRVREGIARLQALEAEAGKTISKSLNFTIMPWSVAGLGAMPDVARALSISVIAIVPYYYFPAAVGEQYDRELRDLFGCPAFSWRGFHHESSGVDFEQFRDQYRQYLANLGEVYNYPYMAFSEQDYRVWFEQPNVPVGSQQCSNVEKLIDIQPNGDANFCVDFPDYVIGNVRQESIEAIWNGERAERFREYRRVNPLAICHRCGAKYMSEM